jgi:hypothetical protein
MTHLKIYLVLHLRVIYLKIYLPTTENRICIDTVNPTKAAGPRAGIIAAAAMAASVSAVATAAA